MFINKELQDKLNKDIDTLHYSRCEEKRIKKIIDEKKKEIKEIIESNKLYKLNEKGNKEYCTLDFKVTFVSKTKLTPNISKVYSLLKLDDFLKVIKIGITDLKKFMALNLINEISEVKIEDAIEVKKIKQK